MAGGEITPFRMQVLMDVAARIVKVMVTGAWHLSFISIHSAARAETYTVEHGHLRR